MSLERYRRDLRECKGNMLAVFVEFVSGNLVKPLSSARDSAEIFVADDS